MQKWFLKVLGKIMVLSISSKQVGFSVFKNAAENALYKICKNFKPKNKNLKYLITDTNGKILKNSYDLKYFIKKYKLEKTSKIKLSSLTKKS